MWSQSNNPIERKPLRYELARDAIIPEAWIIEKERQRKKRKEQEKLQMANH